jgi:hypothetical protein
MDERTEAAYEMWIRVVRIGLGVCVSNEAGTFNIQRSSSKYYIFVLFLILILLCLHFRLGRLQAHGTNRIFNLCQERNKG